MQELSFKNKNTNFRVILMFFLREVLAFSGSVEVYLDLKNLATLSSLCVHTVLLLCLSVEKCEKSCLGDLGH